MYNIGLRSYRHQRNRYQEVYSPPHNNSTIIDTVYLPGIVTSSSTPNITGAPNENIVQNHLNIALLNVFQYLNSGYRHIFIP